MRISRLELSNFRCFKGGTVDLSADLVAIYGRNGAGKTTLFDALEFALFGRVFRIGRFDDSLMPLRYVYAGDADTRVKLETDDGQWVVMSLDRKGNTTITCSQGWTSHLDLLYGLLVDPDYFPTRRSTDSVEAMFRSTLLLSQDSLRRFVEGGAAQRASVLATLAGSAHLHRCAEKAGLVAEEARRRIRQGEDQSRVLTEECERTSAVLADRLARLDEVQRSLASSASLSAADLSQRLAEAGISPPEIPPDLPGLEQFVVRIRAMCEERDREHQRASDILSRIEVGWESHSGHLTQLHQLDLELQQAREGAGSLRRSRDEKEIAHRELRLEIQAAKGQVESLNALVDAFQKRAALRHKQAQIMGEAQQLVERVSLLDRELEAATAEIDRLEDSLNHLETELADVDERLHERRSHGEALEALRIALSALRSSRDRLRAVDNEREAIEASKQHHLQDQRSAPEASEVEEARIERLEAVAAELRQTADERTDLIARLRTHVSDPICPVCGTQHASLEALLMAIDRSLESAPPALQSVADELSSFRQALQQTRERERAAREASAAAAATAGRLSREREGLVSAISACEEEARRLGVDAEVDAVAQAVEAVSAALAELAATREALALQKADLQGRRRTLSYDRERTKDKRDHLVEQHAALADELTLINEDLAVAESVIGRAHETHRPEDEARDAWTSARELSVELEVRGQRLERDMTTTRENLSEATRRERTLEEEKAGLLNRVEEYRELCSSIELMPGASLESLAEARSHLDGSREALRRAEASARRYELVARMRTLEQERNDLTQAREALSVELEEGQGRQTRLRWAERRANTWATMLRQGVNTAIEETAGRHRLSIERHFKSLIPSPHIFDSVSLEFVNGELGLGIRYRNRSHDAGEPRMYLSNAQANVLAIAIFLSLGASERWSRLDTLLMDDPVQHLDDLDSVAFLDTLRATALGRFGPRKQIIVSTCNRNL